MARGEYIPLARGSIFYARGPNGNFINLRANVQESPPSNSFSTTFNIIYLNALTGPR